MSEQDMIYGKYYDALKKVMGSLRKRLEAIDADYFEQNGEHIFEHISSRVKSDESMREKLARKNLPVNAHAAMKSLTDSIGLRIVCSFVDDIYEVAENIKSFDDVTVVTQKDYIKHSKPNGYRSYHMILEVEAPYEDVTGVVPGKFFVEVQLRTIAMDSWASLEHKLKYKKDIPNQELIVNELKRCADEMMSCDLTMQTIKDLIGS